MLRRRIARIGLAALAAIDLVAFVTERQSFLGGVWISLGYGCVLALAYLDKRRAP